MAADGHARGCIDRALLLQVTEGNPSFKDEVKTYMPYRCKRDSANMGVPYSGLSDTNEGDYSNADKSSLPWHGHVCPQRGHPRPATGMGTHSSAATM
eukprot:1613259-Pyramimonas_sp.AAC.1